MFFYYPYYPQNTEIEIIKNEKNLNLNDLLEKNKSNLIKITRYFYLRNNEIVGIKNDNYLEDVIPPEKIIVWSEKIIIIDRKFELSIINFSLKTNKYKLFYIRNPKYIGKNILADTEKIIKLRKDTVIAYNIFYKNEKYYYAYCKTNSSITIYKIEKEKYKMKKIFTTRISKNPSYCYSTDLVDKKYIKLTFKIFTPQKNTIFIIFNKENEEEILCFKNANNVNNIILAKDGIYAILKERIKCIFSDTYKVLDEWNPKYILVERQNKKYKIYFSGIIKEVKN